ncbi:MAG: DUF423 domain-containing protein [Bacteroidia bacterium]|nr:DUF423 domain-containing protein [Bacteroidia bacterium]MDW8015235.1 DUF423 domain-containing protein [Bacteroidia bacterium]
MRWLVVAAGITGALGLLGATIHAHVRPLPALGQAASIALFHAPLLLWLSREKGEFFPLLLAVGFLVGVILFAGAIYLRYLGGIERATVVAPVGGSLLLLSWVGLAMWGLLGK